MHCTVRQCVIHRAGNARTGEVKVIDAAGSEAELLYKHKLRRQLGHIRRNIIAGGVELTVASEPHKVAACISVRAGQAIGGGSGKALAVFHNDLDSFRAFAQFTAAKVEGNGFQPVRAQCVRVQDFKDRAETEARVGVRSTVVEPAAGRIVPANRTARRNISRSILSPRRHPAPVFDISVVLVQYPVPFVALGRATLGIARTCTSASLRRRAQGIVHTAGGVTFAENQTRIVQGIPTCRMRYGIVCHEQAVGIFVLLCILLGGCHLRCELIGIHCSGIGKGNIMHCFVR